MLPTGAAALGSSSNLRTTPADPPRNHHGGASVPFGSGPTASCKRVASSLRKENMDGYPPILLAASAGRKRDLAPLRDESTPQEPRSARECLVPVHHSHRPGPVRCRV